MGMVNAANLTAGLDGVPMAELERRLADAKANNQPGRILRLETKIAEVKGDAPGLKKLKARLAANAPANPPASKVAKIKPGEREAIVREAYLRTLARKPTEIEAETASQHLAGSDDGAKGLRDLLWALLNTKEFITNH